MSETSEVIPVPEIKQSVPEVKQKNPGRVAWG